MRNKPLISILFLATAFLVMWHVVADEGQTQTTTNPLGQTLGGHPIPPGHDISDLEFDVMRLKLPTPSNEPWHFDAYRINSKTCLDGPLARTAVDNIPTWIRIDIREPMTWQAPNMAARYLGSLIQLTQSKDDAIAAAAAMGLYRLGDVNDIGYKKMRAVLLSDSHAHVNDEIKTHSAWYTGDVRNTILHHASFYKDNRFLDAVEELWKSQQKKGTENPNLVDLGWYLEVNGKPRPDAYWLDRLDSASQGQPLISTLMVLDRHRPAGLVDRLEKALANAKAKDVDYGSPRSDVPIIAAALLSMTHQQVYRDYLIVKVKEELEKHRNALTSEDTQAMLDALAMDGDAQSVALLEEIIGKGSPSLQDASLTAFADTKNPKSVSVIANEIPKQIKEKHWPREAFHALLSMRSAEADARYAAFQQDLISGSAGATMTDFADLEFYRQYGRYENILPPIKAAEPSSVSSDPAP